MDSPIGMEKRSILDNSIIATSMESTMYHPSSARLHLNIGGGGWCAWKGVYDVPQYLQVNFDIPKALVALATEGVESRQSWVSEYYLSTAVDTERKTWVFVHDYTGKKVRTFLSAFKLTKSDFN